MRIGALDEGSHRAEGADWIELNALASGGLGFGYSNVMGALDLPEHPQELIDDDGEKLEDEILESRYEPLLEELLTELSWRQDTLGPLYPFEIVRAGLAWRLVIRPHNSVTERAAHETYLLCLIMTALTYKHVEGDPTPALAKSMPNIFQALVYIVSRGIFGGSQSFWMGSPRPGRESFLDALQRFVDELGLGRLKSEPPVSLRGDTKDAGIDIINWRSFADRASTPLLSYGQVASGKEWKDKSVTTQLESHFLHYFETRPNKHYLPTMYIPFLQHQGLSGRFGEPFEAVTRDRLQVDETTLGVIIDRMRLTELVPSALPRFTLTDRTHAIKLARWRRDAFRALKSGALNL